MEKYIPESAVREAAIALHEALTALIQESEGVAGLHLNGDVAPWEELLAGGRYEEWLRAYDDFALATAAPQDEAPELEGLRAAITRLVDGADTLGTDAVSVEVLRDALALARPASAEGVEGNLEGLEAVATPLLRWFRQHYHPHARVIVEWDGIELVQGHLAIPADRALASDDGEQADG
jgi:hypothetical protein